MNDIKIDVKILDLVAKHHKGQKDRAGADYIWHLIHVASGMESYVGKVAGLLHDILEDTNCTIEELVLADVQQEVIDVIKIVTRKSSETYSEYIARVCDSDNYIALKIKLLDLEHNMDLSRLKKVTQKDINRIKKRYKPAHELVQKKINSLVF